MSIRITTGMGVLYDREMPDFPIARINFNLMETEATKYNKKKWWGDFSMGEELKHLGNYLIGFEDARKGECVIIANSDASSMKNKTWYYHFNGRSPLGRK